MDDSSNPIGGQSAEGAKAVSKRSWQDAVPPGDPRYESWLLVRAFLQGEESGSRAERLLALKEGKEVRPADVLKMFERQFAAGAKALAAWVTGIVAAEERANDIDELFDYAISKFKEACSAVEMEDGMVPRLETEARLSLGVLRDTWKEKAFSWGLESEARRIRSRARSNPNEVTQKPPEIESVRAPERKEKQPGAQAVPESGKRRGRLPIHGRKDAIRNAVNKHGENWRDHTGEVFIELDTSDVPLGDFHGMRIDLDGGVTVVSKWADLELAVGDQRRRIIDALRQARR